MSEVALDVDRFFDLADFACEGEASDADFAELDGLLLGDHTTRRRYLDYCRIHVALRLQLRARRATESVQRQINVRSLDAAPSARFFAALQGAVGYFSDGMPLAYLLAAVITGFGLLVSAWIPISEPRQTASSSYKVVAEPKAEYVGRITGMVRCRWQKRSGISDWGSEGQGRQILHPTSYVLNLGWLSATILFSRPVFWKSRTTAAQGDSQGPVTYRVESNGGYLAVGKVTGKLEKKGEGRREKGEEAASLPSPADQPAVGARRGAGGEGGLSNSNRNQPQPTLTLALSRRERGPDSAPSP